jgi:glucose-1-phosphate thymidylyltransferase
VVLAAGLGTRMRADDPDVPLTDQQTAAARGGAKAMMPLNGRPLLDYILSALADAGIRRVALVVAPEHAAIRDHYYRDARPARLFVTLVVQSSPRGTADAVLAAEPWANGEPFLTVNGDNLYPLEALRALCALDEPGLALFGRDELIRFGNIPAERIRAFAVARVTDGGYLSAIVEKPSAAALEAERSPFVSMNCWRFDRRIFDACRAVPRSPRGEFELPQAVAVAMTSGVRFRAVPAHGGVLDLSRRGDAPLLEERLRGVVPHP